MPVEEILSRDRRNHKLCYEIPDTPSYGIFVSTYTRAVF